MKTFIIAEAACTWHIGKSQRHHLAKMLKCIHVAHEAGADACKFQFCSQPAEMAKRRHIANVGTYHMLAWPEKWLPILAAECESVGIEFACTVYIPADVATIAPFVKRFKVASLEAGDSNFLLAHARYGKDILVSVGGCGQSDLSELFDCLSWDHITQLLHCTLAYPAPLGSLNLRVMRCGQSVAIDGLSDHSGDLLTGALAVACDAQTIEVHFRLDETKSDNPDYKHSHNPAGLKAYIAAIRKAEIMLGDGVKKVEECEKPLLKHRVTA